MAKFNLNLLQKTGHFLPSGLWCCSHSSAQNLFIPCVVVLKCHILSMSQGAHQASLCFSLCCCILKDFQKYFSTNSTYLMYLFLFEHMYTRGSTSFYTVVYVNIVHMTAPVRIRQYMPTKGKQCSFAKRKSVFYNVHRCVFLYKKKNNNVEG